MAGRFTLALLAAVAAGCVSMETMQRAETLGKYHAQFGIEPAGWSSIQPKPSAAPALVPATPTATTQFGPGFGVSMRYGFSDSVDFGLRVSLTGVEVATKWRLTPPDAAIIVSIAPAVAGFPDFIGGTNGPFSSTDGFMSMQLPVLIGIPLGENELILGPKLIDYLALEGNMPIGIATSAANAFCLGLTVGFAAKIVPGFQLLPEIGVAFPVSISATQLGAPKLIPLGGVGSNGMGDFGGDLTFQALQQRPIVVQVGLGFLIGE